MIYTIQDIKNSLIGHGTIGQQLIIDADESMLKCVQDRMTERFNEMSEYDIVSMFNNQNGIKLKTFAPGKYFIPSECGRFTCQI